MTKKVNHDKKFSFEGFLKAEFFVCKGQSFPSSSFLLPIKIKGFILSKNEYPLRRKEEEIHRRMNVKSNLPAKVLAGEEREKKPKH
jgi:hypothetical protein